MKSTITVNTDLARKAAQGRSPTRLGHIMRLRSFVACLIGLMAISLSAHAGNSLCSSNEEVLFSCALRGKTVSLCASPELSKDSGYLVYRYGALGKSPELTYPENSIKPADAFTLYHSSYAKGSSTQISFQRREVSYTLYSESNVFDVNGSGIAIEKFGNRVAHLKCNEKSKVVGNLSVLTKLEIPEVAYRDLP